MDMAGIVVGPVVPGSASVVSSIIVVNCETAEVTSVAAVD